MPCSCAWRSKLARIEKKLFIMSVKQQAEQLHGPLSHQEWPQPPWQSLGCLVCSQLPAVVPQSIPQSDVLADFIPCLDRVQRPHFV